MKESIVMEEQSLEEVKHFFLYYMLDWEGVMEREMRTVAKETVWRDYRSTSKCEYSTSF